jgi:hypothetical protein
MPLSAVFPSYGTLKRWLTILHMNSFKPLLLRLKNYVKIPKEKLYELISTCKAVIHNITEEHISYKLSM